MCWQAKIKAPSVDTNQVRAVDPAPLTEEPKGVQFGGDDNDSTEVGKGGKSSLKVKKTSPTSTAKGTKASIRNAAFN